MKVRRRHARFPPAFRRPVPALAVAGMLLLALAPALPAPSAATAPSPWTLLENLRAELESSGPMTARFVQTYIPAGFDQGDHESGHLSIWLPRCLRWNYDEGRSYLLCDGEVHQWNEDEPGGRIFAVDPAKETGLDLLLVDVATLRERYVAGSDELDDGSQVIELATPPAEGDFRARIRLDAAGKRVVGMEYTDGEGNRTRFDIEDYQSLSHTALFQPPSELEWSRE